MKNIFKTTLSLLFVQIYSWAQCPATVTISGTYSTPYTGSNSWIATSGATTIPTSANVIFDANPATNGYVLLNVGFETLTNSTFLAEVQTACALLGFTENKLLKNLEIYPNPTSTSVRINSDSTILATEIVDINGRLIQSLSQNTKDLLLNIENLNSGVYFLKLLTENGNSIEKIIKK